MLSNFHARKTGHRGSITYHIPVEMAPSMRRLRDTGYANCLSLCELHRTVKRRGAVIDLWRLGWLPFGHRGWPGSPESEEAPPDPPYPPVA